MRIPALIPAALLAALAAAPPALGEVYTYALTSQVDVRSLPRTAQKAGVTCGVCRGACSSLRDWVAQATEWGPPLQYPQAANFQLTVTVTTPDLPAKPAEYLCLLGIMDSSNEMWLYNSPRGMPPQFAPDTSPNNVIERRGRLP